MKWKEVIKPNKISILLTIILFFILPSVFHIDLCFDFPLLELFEFESNGWRICVADIILTLLISCLLASFITNYKEFLKGFLKPNKIIIILFVILFVILLNFFFMLPTAICKSLFLGDKFELKFYWSDFDTTMRVVNQEYNLCIGISPIIFIALFAIISYILASSIAYWYKKK